jgi:hypothetical protein
MDKVTSRGLLVALTLVLVVPVARAQKADEKKPAAPAAAPAAAAPAAPAGPPKVAAEMEQLKFFVGKWKCDGKAFASPMSPVEHTFKATAEAKADGGGHWQAFTYEEKKAKDHPELKVHGTWGWDAGNKRFVRAASDDRGMWDSATSPGLQGDKIVWTGELSGAMGKIPFHHSFTKKSDKEWSMALEARRRTASGRRCPR